MQSAVYAITVKKKPSGIRIRSEGKIYFVKIMWILIRVFFIEVRIRFFLEGRFRFSLEGWIRIRVIFIEVGSGFVLKGGFGFNPPGSATLLQTVFASLTNILQPDTHYTAHGTYIIW